MKRSLRYLTGRGWKDWYRRRHKAKTLGNYPVSRAGDVEGIGERKQWKKKEPKIRL